MSPPSKDRTPDSGTTPDATGSGAPAAKPRKARKATARKRGTAAKGTSTSKPKPAAAARDGGEGTAPPPEATGAAPGGDVSSAQAAEGEATAGTVLLSTPMSVRWRDLDAFNHVNNSKYLSYLEEARLRWMIGVPGQGLDDDVAPVVAAAQLNYRRPIEWPAEVMIELFVERLGTTSLSIGHRITAAGSRDTLYCDGYVVMVWIDRETGQAAPLPEAVREACTR